MSSFYGNGGAGGGVSPSRVKDMISKHIIMSSEEPQSGLQEDGDWWFVLSEDIPDPVIEVNP